MMILILGLGSAVLSAAFFFALACYGHQKRCECLLEDFTKEDGPVQKVWYGKLGPTHRRIVFCGYCQIKVEWEMVTSELAEHDMPDILKLEKVTTRVFPDKQFRSSIFSIFNKSDQRWEKYTPLPILRYQCFVSSNFRLSTEDGKLSTSRFSIDRTISGYDDGELMPNLLDSCRDFFIRRDPALKFIHPQECSDTLILASIIDRIYGVEMDKEIFDWTDFKHNCGSEQDQTTNITEYVLPDKYRNRNVNGWHYASALNRNRRCTNIPLDEFLTELKTRDIEWVYPLKYYYCMNPNSRATVQIYTAAALRQSIAVVRNSDLTTKNDFWEFRLIARKRNRKAFLVMAQCIGSRFVGWISTSAICESMFVQKTPKNTHRLYLYPSEIYSLLEDELNVPIFLMIDV